MTDCKHHQSNQSNFYFHSFCPSLSSFSSFHQLDLLLAALIPWIDAVQIPSPTRRRLAGGEATSLKPGGDMVCDNDL
jgi:hypothetical protein